MEQCAGKALTHASDFLAPTRKQLRSLTRSPVRFAQSTADDAGELVLAVRGPVHAVRARGPDRKLFVFAGVLRIHVVELQRCRSVYLYDHLAVSQRVGVHVRGKIGEAAGRERSHLLRVKGVAHANFECARDDGYVFPKRMPMWRDAVSVCHRVNALCCVSSRFCSDSEELTGAEHQRNDRHHQV